MGLITKEVEINLTGSAVKRYSDMGYDIPKYVDDQGRLKVKQGSIIIVKVEDLSEGSNIYIDAECDICHSKNHISYSKYNQNIKRHNGQYICKQPHRDMILHSNESFNKLKCSLKNYLNIHKRFPLFSEFDKDGLLSYSTATEIAKAHNLTLQQVMADIDCFKCERPDIRYYQEYANKYKELIINNKEYTGIYAIWLKSDRIGLPRPDWIIKNCPDDSVIDSKSFVQWLGLYTQNPTKEETIKIIHNMSIKNNGLLKYDDFRGNKYGSVGIATINQYWGSLNKMKDELGLEIIQDSMVDKQLSKEDTVFQIKSLCDKVKSEGRDFITTREFGNKNGTAEYSTLIRMVRKYFNMSFSDYIKTLGLRTGKQGNGTSFKFSDGEVTTSQFEFMFSKFLKTYGLKYNIDYFRDVRYDDFISNYKGNMNCDYVIKYNNKTIYIEIAGIIEAYKTWYYENKPITRSKSKDKYRVKLKQKEEMLHSQNLLYFILFPCDLTNENFIKILDNPSLELRHDIEGFIKNNIDWVKIQEIGKLKYNNNELSCYGQKIVDYTAI